MQVIVDESLGIPQDYLDPSVIIRKTKLKKDKTLTDYFSKEKQSFFYRTLPVLSRTQEEELEEAGEWFSKHKEILYIYDSFTTDTGVLKRLKNWNFPNNRLITVDGANNRAYVIHLLKSKNEREELLTLIFMDTQTFTISSYPNYKKKSKYFKLVRKINKYFYLIDHSSNELIAKGTKEELMDKIDQLYPSKISIIASPRYLNIEKRDSEIYKINEHSLPYSSDNIDILIMNQPNS